MTGQILSFTNLFPSAARGYHGCFVQDRMERVVQRSGLDWQVVCPVPKVPWFLRRKSDRILAAEPAREVVDGTTVHHVHYRHFPGISQTWQAARIAKACLPVVRELVEGKPTVIDAHYLYPDAVAAMQIARKLGLPCVVTARGTDLNVLAERPALRRQMRDAFAGAAARLAVSADLQRRFIALMDGAPALEARNGVDLDRYQPGDAAAARAALGLPADRPLVLGVGRLIEGKGYHDAAAALAAADTGPLRRAVLVLVGEGPHRHRLARVLSPDRLRFLGGRSPEAMSPVYQACDLLVHPSYREGWPNVVTEALACGRPVVGTTVGAIPEICQDPAVTRLCAPGDRVALGAAIAEFLDNPPKPAQARALAARYSWSETVDMLSELFRKSLS